MSRVGGPATGAVAQPPRLLDELLEKALAEPGGQNLAAQGRLISANQLQRTDTATTVRVRNDEVLTTDGPFAETKETLGGYYLIEADSLDEALEWAAQIPSARDGLVEVRPVVMREAGVAR